MTALEISSLWLAIDYHEYQARKHQSLSGSFHLEQSQKHDSMARAIRALFAEYIKLTS
jgi:hypothetical protein